MNERLKSYFPFFKAVELVDLENLAFFYLNGRSMIKNGVLQEYHPNHMRRKVGSKTKPNRGAALRAAKKYWITCSAPNRESRKPAG
jgi:hypothetical protein